MKHHIQALRQMLNHKYNLHLCITDSIDIKIYAAEFYQVDLGNIIKYCEENKLRFWMDTETPVTSPVALIAFNIYQSK